jgi:phospholipid/cholesterol/gamma-HCH transport system substrate-binding protein
LDIKRGSSLVGKIETRVGIFVLLALAVFVYMGFQIGAFRFDRGRYAQYILTFKDVSGLSRKADVKIAGVKVGWVEKVTLKPNDDMYAEVIVMILKEYSLYHDAYAMVRQDGLLGPKYVEIVPGDPLLRKLSPGDPLSKPSTEPVSVDELLQQFKKIATNVDEATTSIKDVIGGVEGREQLQNIFNNIQTSMERLSSVSDVLDRALVRNEDHIDNFMQIGTTFQTTLDKISTVFDRDFNRIASKFETTVSSFEEATIQARDGLRSISSVAEKIDEGKGVLGKLVNEDETYHDLKLAVEGFKNYLTKIDRMQVVFDTHFESMIRQAEGYTWEDSKGFFGVRIYPREDYFYLVQIVSSEKGYIRRKTTETDYVDSQGKPISFAQAEDRPFNQDRLDLDDLTRLAFVQTFNKKTITRDLFKVDLQFGKIFKDIAFRLGLFEGTAGIAADIDIPFKTDKFRWVTSLEMYDFNGRNRFVEDRRPHIKWLNKIFILRNIYTTFGADDFVSKRNASVFFGAGIRFGDDDIKYFLSSISGVGSTSFLQV